MRIISDDAIWSLNDYIKKWDTIEITDDDMNKIKLEYDNYIDRQLKWIGQDLSEGKITENEMFDKFSSLPKFSQYLKDLIVLAIQNDMIFCGNILRDDDEEKLSRFDLLDALFDPNVSNIELIKLFLRMDI